MTAATLETRKNRTALLAFGGALAMLGLGYAAVPLYELFCQVTGFGGTTFPSCLVVDLVDVYDLKLSVGVCLFLFFKLFF